MEKKILLENDRIYDKADLRIACIEFTNSKMILTFSLISLLFAVIGGSSIGLSFVFDNDITILVSGIITLAMILFIWAIYFIRRYQIDKRDFKSTEYKYTFYDDALKVSVNSESLNQHSVIKYSDIKCVKCKTYTFISLDNNSKAYFFLNSDLNEEVYNTLKNKAKKYKGK